MAFNIEGEGLLDIFFYYTWLKIPGDSGQRGFSVPDTIIYKYQQPRVWFFTSVDGVIKKKSKEKLKPELIEKAFLTKVSRSGIVAWYIYIESGKRVVEFLNVDDFRHLLRYRKKAQEGILQKFIKPKGEKNSLIQMVWTPNVSLFEVRENLKDLYDLRYDVYERAFTFEGEEFHSESRQVFSKELKAYLEHHMKNLVRHIAKASLGKMSINRMVLHFKQSKKGTLWLIRPCSIRCSNGMMNSPIEIDSEIKLPETINTHKFSLTPQNAMAFQKTVLCRNCSQPMESDKMCEISYRMIISVTPTSKMPKLLEKIHTQMNPSEYEKFKHNPLFLSKQTLVCDMCFLKYANKTELSGGGSRPQTMSNVRIFPLDPGKTAKRRDLTNVTINEKLQVSRSSKNIHISDISGLPRVNTAAQLTNQKSLAKMLGMNDITAFLEQRYANRRLITR